MSLRKASLFLTILLLSIGCGVMDAQDFYGAGVTTHKRWREELG